MFKGPSNWNIYGPDWPTRARWTRVRKTEAVHDSFSTAVLQFDSGSLGGTECVGVRGGGWNLELEFILNGPDLTYDSETWNFERRPLEI